MRLTKLELYGFKSFAKKTEIQFDKGITAIIGPNGSGKSNIADSIRWVLGEQSAKLLRGNKMEDVIFGGTATRKAMSYCEVTLTFDNSDGQLPVDYAEVSVTRRVYRSGESEYCLNKTACRLRDLQELFRDTGLGKEGYSIVGQGKVEEILSNKSGERRKAFEEAAGIMKYRVRKEEAERNLDNTRKNLVRLCDILSEMEERVEPLREQADTASTYLKLRDELRELDINLFLIQYDKVIERIKNSDAAIAQLTENISELESQRATLSESCEKAEEKERSAGDDLSALNTELVAATSSYEAHLGDLKVLNEKILNAEKDHAALLERIKENEKRRDELSERINSHDTQSDERDGILSVLHEEYEKAQAELAEVTKQTEEKESYIEQLKNAMIEAANKLGDAKSNLSRLSAQRESLQKRLDEMTEDSSSADKQKADLEAELSAAQVELDKLLDDKKTLHDELDDIVSHSNECTFNLRKISDEIRQAEQLLESKKSRFNTLMDMKKAHDGYYSGIQKLLSDASHDKKLSSCIEGTVAEIIKVPEKYEVALEMAMGATLQNIVTPDEDAAKYAISYLRDRRYGRATFLPVTVMRPRTFSDDEKSSVRRLKGCIGIASELVQYAPRHKNIVENLLGKTLIVDNIDNAVSISRFLGQSARIATLNGDIINPGGSMTGGSTGKMLNLLGRERECADILSEINSLKKSLSELTSRKEETEKALSQASEIIKAKSEDVHSLDIDIAKQKDKVDIIKEQLDKLTEKCNQSGSERSRITDSINDIDSVLEEARKTQEELSSGSATTQSDIIAAQKELAQLRKELSEKTDAVTDLKMRIVALEKEADALKGEYDRLCRDIAKLSETIEQDKAKESNFAMQQEQLQVRMEELTAIIEKEKAENDTLTLKYHSLEEVRNSLLSELDDLRRKKANCEDELDDLKERKHRQEIAKTKSENELASIQDRIWQDYELTYENAEQYRRELPLAASTQRASELKRQIRDLGDININAIEEFRTLNERYTTLCTQCDDLKNAENDLVSLIDELVSKMEVNFREKFTQICTNFKKVFTELFGGGTAELILSDDKDILNCDIDILAQIPGKKLQSLSPLSGGERALTAIALQFAILGLKPTAFCLLDEIDASLDEVNVSRFAEYIHAYAESTQFILITHRKGSMESCNAIYGVAQEEKGVSQVVSARITPSTIQ